MSCNITNTVYGQDVDTIRTRLHDAALRCGDLHGLYPVIMKTTNRYKKQPSSHYPDDESFLYDRYLMSCDKKKEGWSNKELEYITGLNFISFQNYPEVSHYTGLNIKQAIFLISNLTYTNHLTNAGVCMETVVMSNESGCALSEAYAIAKDMIINKHVCCYWRDALAFLHDNRIQWLIDIMSGKIGHQHIAHAIKHNTLATAYESCAYEDAIPEDLWRNYVKDFFYYIEKELKKTDRCTDKNSVNYLPSKNTLNVMCRLPDEFHTVGRMVFIHRLYDFCMILLSRAENGWFYENSRLDPVLLKDTLIKLRPGASKIPMAIMAEDLLLSINSAG